MKHLTFFTISLFQTLPSATDALWTCWFIAIRLKLVTCILLSCVLFVWNCLCFSLLACSYKCHYLYHLFCLLVSFIAHYVTILCVYRYLHVYVYRYLCLYLSIIDIYICVYIDTYVYMYMCIYMSMYIDIYVSMNLGIYTSMYLECIFLCT